MYRENRLRKADQNKFHVAKESPKRDQVTSLQLTIGAESMASFNSATVSAFVPSAVHPPVPVHQRFSTPTWYSARIVPKDRTIAHNPAKVTDGRIRRLVRLASQPAAHRKHTAP